MWPHARVPLRIGVQGGLTNNHALHLMASKFSKLEFECAGCQGFKGHVDKDFLSVISQCCCGMYTQHGESNQPRVNDLARTKTCWNNRKNARPRIQRTSL